MSSTLACHFQAPVHAAAHMYKHSEMEPQQHYSNNSHLSDSRFPADAIDVDSYSAVCQHAVILMIPLFIVISHDQHTEGFYDKGGYNRLPSGFGSSQFEDAEAVFRYNRMLNEFKFINNANTSPQLLCPRPTLPPSQFSPQFSWSDWPSEPPIGAYQTYSEHTPHHPEATDTNLQLSFQNQNRESYPAFVETVPGQNNSTDGEEYAQHPFSASSFEQDLTYLTSHPRYYAAVSQTGLISHY